MNFLMKWNEVQQTNLVNNGLYVTSLTMTAATAVPGMVAMMIRLTFHQLSLHND